ncbi:hypothetical protein THASP1DRAFT_33773 [Thamnocephalis sphaerospora]|uniref:Uncharacterized protein n=1 Tax=Thamnocephalis sphaerospora TaxID=78915 RepID=A0A4P9XFT9_9FUNG|nr:hypothetical protein THASP1DRAFT_33773 [Thamnocephalis sphaerospora]|eukprot:RKP04456.1 hypothetical protein THASP1DRAFT_33773 [Thamnocephalis sphaerospora]
MRFTSPFGAATIALVGLLSVGTFANAAESLPHDPTTSVFDFELAPGGPTTLEELSNGLFTFSPRFAVFRPRGTLPYEEDSRGWFTSTLFLKSNGKTSRRLTLAYEGGKEQASGVEIAKMAQDGTTVEDFAKIKVRYDKDDNLATGYWITTPRGMALLSVTRHQNRTNDLSINLLDSGVSQVLQDVQLWDGKSDLLTLAPRESGTP